MTITLETILSATRRRVAEAKKTTDLSGLAQRAREHQPRHFGRELREASRRSVAIIAELKKASPSRGIIRQDFNPSLLAHHFAGAGATALSVLTDAEFFQGSLQNLHAASAATKLPCLRKDFVVDKFQLIESKANCADAVLLIVAALDGTELQDLACAARELELDVLCEVHDERELECALSVGCDIIGVNSRNLRTFQVDIEVALRLAAKIPKNVLRVAESGITSASDILSLQEEGYDAFLIGESLMKAAHPGNALRELIAAAKKSAVNASSTVRG